MRTAYRRHDRTVHVAAVRAGDGELADVAAAAAAPARRQPPDTAVVDIYLALAAGRRPTTDALATGLGLALAAANLPEDGPAGRARRPRTPKPAPTSSRSAAPTRTGERPFWMADGNGDAPGPVGVRGRPHVPRRSTR